MITASMNSPIRAWRARVSIELLVSCADLPVSQHRTALSLEVGLHPGMIAFEHGFNGSFGYDLAVGQRGDAVARVVETLQIVRHHEHCQTQRLLQGADQLVEVAGRDRVEAGSGLVE